MQASLVAQWENLSAMQVDCKRYRFGPWVGKIPWRRSWQPSPVFLPGEFHGQRSLVGYSLWGLQRIRHHFITKQQQQHQNSPPLLHFTEIIFFHLPFTENMQNVSSILYIYTYIYIYIAFIWYFPFVYLYSFCLNMVHSIWNRKVL